MTYTQEQFDKLPKWAQSEINLLKSSNKSLNERLDAFTANGETNTYIIWGLTRKPLPKDSIVEFQTGEDNKNKVSVYVRSDGRIDINTDSRLGETMVLMPRAANAFYVDFIK